MRAYGTTRHGYFGFRANVYRDQVALLPPLKHAGKVCSRDEAFAAFQQGTAARLAGQPRTACPHGRPVADEPDLRLNWLNGWDSGGSLD
jgi:ribosome modulation factor